LKQITMVHITNSIVVVAFVSVLFFHGHYHHEGVGMVAAAASGGEVRKADRTSRGTMLTTLERVPVLTRKLSKNSKASKPDATEDTDARLRLVRSLVIYTSSMYRSAPHFGRELQTEPQTVADGLFKDFNWRDCFRPPSKSQRGNGVDNNEDTLCGYSRDDCLALYEGYPTEADSDLFCKEVSPVISAYILDKLRDTVFYETKYSPENTYDVCMIILQCPSTSLVEEDGDLLQKSPSMCCDDYFQKFS